jgi:tetratricopeptide (TPR) repeat protein
MIRTRSRFVVVVLVSFAAVLAPRAAAGQEALAKAMTLYASAEYEEALSVLNKVENASDAVEVDQYRALCLLALGRTDDARLVIQRIVEKAPSFEPSAAQVSPRVQETFRDVRRKVLPSVVRKEYADAKTAFDRGDTERARGIFQNVVAHLEALDKMGIKDLADLQVLSKGFLDLTTNALKAAAPPPPAPVVAPPPPRREEPAAPQIYGLGDAGVVAPVPISQPRPPYTPGRDTQTYDAVLTIVIDETGGVTDVSSMGDLPVAYEVALKRSVMGWRFRPATRNGTPVKYRRNIAIRLAPQE